KMLDKYVSKPTFIASKIFDENLVAIHNMQDKIVLDKPIYVGFSILDISKTLMYDFHYNYIKKKYSGNRSVLHYMDTDSLIYTITEFIGLKSKMYSIKFYNGDENKRAKGIVQSVTKNEIRHDMYNDTLKTSGSMYSKMTVIRTTKHQLYTMTMNKISLSAYDD